MRWKKLGSKSKKSLKELKAEVKKLEDADKKLKAYQELQREKERLRKEIKKKGFQIRHRKALSIIKQGENLAKKIAKDLRKPKK